MSDGIVLLGLPGTGKTRVGRCVAEMLGRPFVDLDEEIERSTGRSPADHIRGDGEAAFRTLERHAVDTACRTPGSVIAAGGGAPLDPLNRWAFMRHGLRIRLDVPVDELVARLAADPVARPLLGKDHGAGVQRTMDERAPFYRAVDVALDAGGSPEEVASAVVDAHRQADVRSGWRTLYDAQFRRHHPIGPEHGRILMGRGMDAASLAAALEAFDGRAPTLIADRRALAALPSLDAALPAARRLEIAGGERAKSFRRLAQVLGWLTEIGAERTDPLLAAGGGTVGDLAGLAAALHHRGMPLVQLPTTWLAQADSSIGGKVAVDLPSAKNAVGAVWPAWVIVSDVEFLRSLPVGRRRDGLAECLKAGLIGDAALWEMVEQRGANALAGDDDAAVYAITERAVRLKLAVVDRDPFENGERRVLNLGHTLGHALEVQSGYRLPHGVAVALGLRGVAAIAVGRGAERGLCERIDNVLRTLGFPLRRGFDPVAATAALSTDKKRDRGAQRWILPMAVGRVEEVSDVTASELRLAMDAIREAA